MLSFGLASLVLSHGFVWSGKSDFVRITVKGQLIGASYVGLGNGSLALVPTVLAQSPGDTVNSACCTIAVVHGGAAGDVAC